MTWAEAIEATRVGVAIRQSTWMFALMEVVHLFGLALVLGTTLLVTLRLFGVGLRAQSVWDVASDAWPWSLTGLALSVFSGVVLSVSEAVKLAASPPFAAKMGLFLVAVVYTAMVHRRLLRGPMGAGAARVSAVVALVLWFGVALAGRAIAFY